MTRTTKQILVRQIPEDSYAATDVDGNDQRSGFGALQTERGCLPLTALEVSARITGLCAHVQVKQAFRNASDEPLEATYIFPLPDRAAVTSFRMRVGERIIDGELKERGEAREQYQQAIEAGHRASIAEEDRSGTFNLQVGNIPPREDVAVELTLVMPLPVAHGQAEFRFPLVVAPRYVSGMPLDGPSVGAGWASDTDAVPDASRVTPPVLLPGFANPVRLGLEVELDPAELDGGHANDWAGRIECSLHSAIVEAGPPWKVRLQPGERLNRDFLLRFPVAAEAVQTTLLAAESAGSAGAGDDEPGTFALTLVPPALRADVKPAPRDVVIVLDRSGSMGGWKMVAARRAVGRMIDTLLDDDRFTVLAFDNTIERPPQADQQLVAGTNRNRWRALEWLGKIEARGGTEMAPALKLAAELLAKASPRRRPVVVLVTDGQVAGEDAVLRTLSSAAGKRVPHIYTLGIDRSVNAGFLRRLADLGGGTCDLVETESRLDEAMDHIHRAIGQPALTGLRIEAVDGELVTDSLSPGRLPDVFADRPVTVFGRLKGNASSFGIRVTAKGADGSVWQREVESRPAPAATLRSLWGRARVRDLEDRYAAGSTRGHETLAQQIVAVSLSSGVLSRFTAYVAVDRSEVVNQGGRQQRIVQPVEMPEGWGDYECVDSYLRETNMPEEGYARELPRFRSFPLMRQAMPAEAQERSLAFPIADLVPSTVEEVVGSIEILIQPVDDSRRLNLGGRRAGLQMTIELLDRAIALLEKSPDADVDIVAALDGVRQRARELLRDYTGGNRAALSAGPLNQLFTDIRQALARLATSPPTKPPTKRNRFWT